MNTEPSTATPTWGRSIRRSNVDIPAHTQIQTKCEKNLNMSTYVNYTVKITSRVAGGFINMWKQRAFRTITYGSHKVLSHLRIEPKTLSAVGTGDSLNHETILAVIRLALNDDILTIILAI